jgi:hypothetical protein
MAISLVTAPTSPALAYSPVVFQLNSNNADIVHLIIETVVSYDGGTVFLRKSATSVQPNLGTTNEFTFDISDVLSVNIDFILKTLGSSAVINDADNLQFKIKAYEVTQNPIILISITKVLLLLLSIGVRAILALIALVYLITQWYQMINYFLLRVLIQKL